MDVDETELDSTANNDGDVDVGDADEEDGCDDNFDTSAVIADEERDQGGDNEDNSTQVWDATQDNFDDFQFTCEEDGQEIGPTSTVEDVRARLAGLWNDGDKVLTAKINRSRRFVCVDYPGVVQNLDKALATLEGTEAISKVLSENGRLPLYFRPDDCYCKPVFANCTFSQNLLVRVRRRKKKKISAENIETRDAGAEAVKSRSTPDEDPDGYEYQLVVDGIVDRLYSFEGMCDFQYLPVAKGQRISKSTPTEGDGSLYKEFLSQLVPQFEDEREEYLSREPPLFLPPLVFSRRQLPLSFQFEDDQPSTKSMDVIETERKKRILGSIHVTFDHPGVPMEPHPDGPLCLQKLPKNQQESGLAAVKKLFEERPLWSKAGLQVNIESMYRQYITFLLPMVAFYFTNGAWKSLWCKLGYDPRKEPASKVYQTVDFRIRKLVNRVNIDAKREQVSRGLIKFNTETPSNSSSVQPSGEVQYMSNMNATYAAKNTGKVVKELVYVFHLGMLPPFRQMRYQVCDIHHPQIQAKLHENDGKESVCTEKDGWCVPDFTNSCRDILHREVERLQAAQGQ